MCPLTYWFDEIESVDGVKQISSLAKEKTLSQENNLTSVDTKAAEEYFRRGDAYGRQGNPAQAIFSFTKAIEMNLNYAEAYYYRGVTYYYTKEYDKAWVGVHKAEALGFIVNSKFLADLKKASGRDE